MFYLCTLMMALSTNSCHNGNAEQAAKELAQCNAAGREQCGVIADYVDDKGVHVYKFGYYKR